MYLNVAACCLAAIIHKHPHNNTKHSHFAHPPRPVIFSVAPPRYNKVCMRVPLPSTVPAYIHRTLSFPTSFVCLLTLAQPHSRSQHNSKAAMRLIDVVADVGALQGSTLVLVSAAVRLPNCPFLASAVVRLIRVSPHVPLAHNTHTCCTSHTSTACRGLCQHRGAVHRPAGGLTQGPARRAPGQ